jgi:hypothetical protein
VVPVTAEAVGGCYVKGNTKSDERVASGRRALETTFGDDFHGKSGTWRRVSREFDRKNDRYRETVHDEDGTVIRELDEPLSEHQGHGRARRSDN